MRLGWRGALGILITALLLWWALRDVSPAFVIRELAHSSIPLFALATVAATAIFALRAARWRVILEPVTTSVSFAAAWRATTIGMMANNVAPARAGELVRAYALTREAPDVPLPASIASLVVDRVFDLLVIVILGLLALADPALPSTAVVGGRSVASWAAVGGVLGLILLAALYAVVAFPNALIAGFEMVVRRLSPRLEDRGRAALRAFSDGLGALKSPWRFLRVLGWTVLHWLLNALAFWLGFLAVGIDAPFSAALLTQSLVAFGVAVPAAPGFFGVFEALTIVALGLYGVDRSLATTFAIGFHVLTFIPVTVLGGYYASRLGFRWRELHAPNEAQA